MNKGKRYSGEERLNYKKVVAALIALFVIIMFILIIKDLIKEAKNTKNTVAVDYYALYANNKWGIVGTNGDTVIEPMYQEMPIVINKPVNSINALAIILFAGITLITELTKVSIPPVDFNTAANPAATSITNAMYPIRPTPSSIKLSILWCFIVPVPKIIPKPTNAPSGRDFVTN